MAPPLVPSPIMRAACPPRQAAAPGLAPDPATHPVPDPATKLALAGAAVVAALAQVLAILPAQVLVVAAEAAPVEVVGPAQAQATLTDPVPAINPAVVGTRSRFRDE
jgi:hypothetical protein